MNDIESDNAYGDYNDVRHNQKHAELKLGHNDVKTSYLEVAVVTVSNDIQDWLRNRRILIISLSEVKISF
jgi:hypothetical protein